MDREVLGTLHPDDIEQVLAKVATCQAALMGDLVSLAQEVIRRKLWQADGARAAADWLAERLSLGERDARQLCRVARALEDRPLLHTALTEGALSWAKLLPLIELCTEAEAETWWLDYSNGATVEHLEALARRQRSERRDTEALQRGHNSLRLFPQPDSGALKFWGLLFGDDAARFQTLIEHLARNELRPLPGEHPAPWDERCGDALAMLSSAALGGISRDRATINVHLDAEAAATNARSGEASMKPPFDYPLSPSVLERLFCDGRCRTVLDRDGEPTAWSERRPPAARPRTSRPTARRALCHQGMPQKTRADPPHRMAKPRWPDHLRQPRLRVLAASPHDPRPPLDTHRPRRRPHLAAARQHHRLVHRPTTTRGLTPPGVRPANRHGQPSSPPPRCRCVKRRRR